MFECLNTHTTAYNDNFKLKSVDKVAESTRALTTMVHTKSMIYHIVSNYGLKVYFFAVNFYPDYYTTKRDQAFIQDQPKFETIWYSHKVYFIWALNG